ncbi:MAG TPA: hypothetical protein VGX68_21300 [Thermoanaerobaculia bacterium]|jgi:hypothetical protein|nr:hypothetical protein [Thermoanaerobaculia bacterium]
MAGPLPVNPFRRQIVAVSGERYALGTVDWLRRPRFMPGLPAFVDRNEDSQIRARLASIYEGRIFLHWARFPFYQIGKAGDGRVQVSVTDARYTIEPGTGFGRLTLSFAR